jgi:hypothetical protein
MNGLDIDNTPMKTTHYKNVLLGKNRHREKKRIQLTTQEYNVEIPKSEEKRRPLSKSTTRE